VQGGGGSGGEPAVRRLDSGFHRNDEDSHANRASREIASSAQLTRDDSLLPPRDDRRWAKGKTCPVHELLPDKESRGDAGV